MAEPTEADTKRATDWLERYAFGWIPEQAWTALVSLLAEVREEGEQRGWHDAWECADSNDGLRAARREGREEMREKAAQTCFRTWDEGKDMAEKNGLSHGCVASARAIRGLPLDGPEEGR